jgi:hypothetical protein
MFIKSNHRLDVSRSLYSQHREPAESNSLFSLLRLAARSNNAFGFWKSQQRSLLHDEKCLSSVLVNTAGLGDIVGDTNNGACYRL